MKSYFLLSALFFSYGVFSFAGDLDSFVQKALEAHPAVEQKKFEVQGEEANLSTFVFLEDPMLGWMKEGEMNSWTLSQGFKFPLKYKALRDIQKRKLEASYSGLTLTQWEYRAKIISTLFKHDIYAQNIKFIEAQKNSLKEALKLMSSRRATGGVKQQEELRAYLEQTKLETEFLLAKQMYEEASAELEGLVGSEALKDIPHDFKRPKLSPLGKQELKEIVGPDLKVSLANLEGLRAEKSLARYEYFPDFKLSTKQPLKKDEGVKTYAVEMTVPLWFMGKQMALSDSASAKMHSIEKEVEFKRREQNVKVQSLVSKINNMEKLLELYESSLLPQAQSSLQSNLSAYKVGSSRFLEVVEAERLLYQEKMAYLDNTLKFIEAILELEKNLGKTISSFPQG